MTETNFGDLFDPPIEDKMAIELFNAVLVRLETLGVQGRIATINALKRSLHNASPFRAEPVDCVQWVRNEGVAANDYNPNSVAPPEMELLRLSIEADGYTQPIVSYLTESGREVVDGFHRSRVGKECESVKARCFGYVPVVTINQEREDRDDRIAATIRHNRARGKHKVDSMSDIVLELKRRNRSDEWIAKNLGMDPDEVLRLAQITGLAELFQNQDFSRSWEIGQMDETEVVKLVGDE